MGADGQFVRRLRTMALAWADAAAYAAVVAAVATLVAVVVGVASGGGLVRAKYLLFLGGFALMAYATVRLWPTSISDVEEDTAPRDPTGRTVPEAPDRTRFQAFVRALPPVRWLPPPPIEARISPAGKLLLGSVFVLLVSYLMEAVFGIADPPY